jgi:16S rRNA (cytidine1402-2'-O)-methyltransferase
MKSNETSEAKQPGILYMVGTPIGNLEDITLRALRILKEVDGVLCEDTRVTKKLLTHFDIPQKTLSFHEHSDERKKEVIIQKLLAGESWALVTDAGTPGVSDPGNALVERVLERGICVEPIPGVAAVTALVSVAGVDMREFVFLGFPPHKKGRQTFFQEVLASKYPSVYFESPHRIVKNIDLLIELGGGEKQLIVGRELTKFYEDVIRGSAREVQQYFADSPDKVRGEFTIIVV